MMDAAHRENRHQLQLRRAFQLAVFLHVIFFIILDFLNFVCIVLQQHTIVSLEHLLKLKLTLVVLLTL